MGLCLIEDIEDVVDEFFWVGGKDIILFWCNSLYLVDFCEVYFVFILDMIECFGVFVGYLDYILIVL